MLATVVVALTMARAGATEPPPPGPITRIDNPHKRIAITFDACATKTHGYGFDRSIYQVLQAEKVPATIFTSGRWVEFHPQVMAELAADPLIEFGNHSYDHPHMSRLGAVKIDAEIDQTEAALGRFGKQSVAFRPPFGDFNARLLQVVGERGLPVVLWDVVSGDPSAAATTRGIIHVVGQKTRSGSIVIFHINGRGKRTASALPTILHDLRARGFELVHLSTLLAWRAAGDAAGAPSDAKGRAARADGLSSVVLGPMPCVPLAPWEHIVPRAPSGADEVCP